MSINALRTCLSLCISVELNQIVSVADKVTLFTTERVNVPKLAELQVIHYTN